MIDLLFVALFQAAAGAPAEPAAPPADPAAAPATDTTTPAPTTTDQVVDPSQVVRCRTSPSTGSRVRVNRICTTQREDNQRARTNRNTVSNMQNRGANQPGGGN